MKINSEKFKKDFIEKKASQGIDEAAKNQFLEGFYGSKPVYNSGPGKVTEDVLEQVSKIVNHISELGLTKFADLKTKFTFEEYSERPMAQIMLIKESMEAILFAIETGDRKKEELVNQFKDRYFACSDGTLTNLQGILAEMVMSDNKVESYFTLQKKAFMEQVAIGMLKEKSFPEFEESHKGMEIHDVSSLLNSISEEYGLVKKTKEEDIHVKDNISDLSKALLISAIEHILQDNNVADTFIDGVAQRIQDNLPYYEASKEEFFTELTSALEATGLTEIINSNALLKYEGYKTTGYKDNIHAVLKDAVMLHLHNTGAIQVPNLEEVKTRIAIENSVDEDVSANRVTKNVLENAKANGTLEYAVKYIYTHGVKLDEEGFPDMSIMEYIVSDLGAQQALKIALESSSSIEDIEYCFKQGAKIEAGFGTDLNKALKLAIEGGHSEMVALLSEKGARIEPGSGIDLNFTLLRNIEKGNKEMVRVLLDAGADPSVRYTQGDNTAVMLAIKGGHTEIVRMLLEKGAYISWKNRLGDTAFKLAIESGHTEMVAMLSEKGAKIEPGSGIDLNLDLLRNIEKGNKDIVKVLLDAGADPSVRYTQGDNTALMLAIKGGYTEIAWMLLEKVANVSWKNRYGDTALKLAIEGGHSEMVAKLAEKGGKIEPDSGIDLNLTLLRNIEKGNKEIVKVLLDASANVDIGIVDQAIKMGDTEIVEAILDRVREIQAENTELAVYEGINTENVNAIKALDFDVNKNYRQGTPLILAIKKGNIEIVKFLIEKGADVNQTYNGAKPLHTAIAAGNMDMVRLLVEKGADVNAIDGLSSTPLSRAVLAESVELGDKIEIFKYLLLTGANTAFEFVDSHSSAPVSIEKFLELHPDPGRNFTKEIASYKRLHDQVSEVLTDRLREGLQGGKYRAVDVFISDFIKQLEGMDNLPQFKHKFMDKVKGFETAKDAIKLNWYEEFKAEVIGFFKGTGAQEIEIAKLNKYLNSAYDIVQNHSDYIALADDIKDVLGKRAPEQQRVAEVGVEVRG